jgi:hypothetical protein
MIAGLLNSLLKMNQVSGYALPVADVQLLVLPVTLHSSV